MKTGALENAIHRYKFDDKWGWGLIFARVLLGYLYDNPHLTAPGTMIIPSPTYVEPAMRHRPQADHMRWILEQARDQDDQHLPFALEPSIITKKSPTRKLKEMNLADRTTEAAMLREALVIPNPSRVHGRAVVVVDDVFTTGTTLNTIAGKLLNAGAATVDGLVLARQPWNDPSPDPTGGD